VAALLVILTALPALAANLIWEVFDDDPFPVWPPEDLKLEEGEEEPPPPWEPDWVDVRTADVDNTLIVPGYEDGAVAIEIPQGTYRGTGARYRFEGEQDELFFSYLLRFDDWNTTSDGKLPGPSGIYSSSGLGCNPSTEESPGWSARMLFKANGTEPGGPEDTVIGYYVYHLDQPGNCGQNMIWDPGVVVHNRWYCVEGHVRMNTPGSNNGVLEGWLDGELAMSRSDLAFRRASEPDVHIREWFHNVYHGGVVTAPSVMHLSIDRLIISDTKRPGCPDPFSDDNGSVHEPAMNELKALSVFNGCGDGLSCWEDTLSRAEMAVLLDRSLGLAGTGVDFFTDDDMWAEASINRLAAAEITAGCGEGLFCPFDDVPRRQFAIMLERALDLPVASGDYFSDDNGVFGEDAINALAQAGLVVGCAPDTFCTEDLLNRGQAATLIRRALDWIAEQG
jgi:hypothetical protein